MLIIFDNELSPRHQRELEERFKDEVRVIDRTALYLIFLPNMQIQGKVFYKLNWHNMNIDYQG